MEKENEIVSRTLSIDCAVGTGSVAVLNGVSVLASSSDVDGSPARAEEVLQVIRSVLNEAGTLTSDLNVIAASVGPGSYSGIRIGLATAFGLAGALSLNCVGVSVLDALSVTAESDGKFVAAVGVGKRHIGWNSFDVSSGDRPPASMLVMQSDDEFGRSLESFDQINVICDSSLSDRIQAVAPRNAVVVESKQTIAELVGIFAYRFPERASLQPIYLRDQSGQSGQPIIKP